MSAGLVAQHQQTSFATPINGAAGDATVVLGNDNATVSTYNTHDADGTIHVQSSTAAVFAATPAGTAGRKWLTNDAGGVYLYYDTGSAWVEANYLRNTGGSITSSSATAFTVGRQGATDPAFQVDASTAVSVTGLKVKAGAAGSGVALSTIGSGTNESLLLDAKGTGVIQFGGTSTGSVVAVPPLNFQKTINSATAFATPSALAATMYIGFASAVNGAVTMGYGTTYDVAWMNRDGTVVMACKANDTEIITVAKMTIGAGATVSSGGMAVTGNSTISGTLGVTGAVVTVTAGGTSNILIGQTSDATTYNSVSLNGVRTDAGKLGIGGGGGTDKTLYVDVPATGAIAFRVATTTILQVVTAGQLQFSNITATPAGLTDGQLWYDGTNLRARLGGATRTVTVS